MKHVQSKRCAQPSEPYEKAPLFIDFSDTLTCRIVTFGIGATGQLAGFVPGENQGPTKAMETEKLRNFME